MAIYTLQCAAIRDFVRQSGRHCWGTWLKLSFNQFGTQLEQLRSPRKICTRLTALCNSRIKCKFDVFVMFILPIQSFITNKLSVKILKLGFNQNFYHENC